MQERLLATLDTDDRIAYVSRRGEKLFNFWRDTEHPRGLWHTTNTESYLSGTPNWEVLIDVDALATAEDENWVWKSTKIQTTGLLQTDITGFHLNKNVNVVIPREGAFSYYTD